jgi:serine/threonine protein kinase
MNNLAIHLDKSFDNLTEEQLGDIFPKVRRQSLDAWFQDSPSPGPKYAVKAIKLSRLPAEYLSTRLCVFDFDQSFMAHSPPQDLSHIPPAYPAPESIFSLINSPEADIWALGSILFRLRTPNTQLFWDFSTSGPLATAIRMHEVLGTMPEEWYTLPFVNNYPVHGPLQPNTECHMLKDMRMDDFTLEQLVNRIVDPYRPEDSMAPRIGAEKLCVKVPRLDILDEKGKEDLKAKHTTPIQAQDAEHFTDLLRRVFAHDSSKRITAKGILEHPWLVVERGQP